MIFFLDCILLCGLIWVTLVCDRNHELKHFVTYWRPDMTIQSKISLLDQLCKSWAQLCNNTWYLYMLQSTIIPHQILSSVGEPKLECDRMICLFCLGDDKLLYGSQRTPNKGRIIGCNDPCLHVSVSLCCWWHVSWGKVQLAKLPCMDFDYNWLLNGHFGKTRLILSKCNSHTNF